MSDPLSNHVLEIAEEMHADLTAHGWCHLLSVGEQNFIALAAKLGETIHETEVIVRPESRGMITSNQALDFHTDHSKADYVAWLCLKPDDEGGETILADARKAFSLLELDDQKMLESVFLKEHDIFENDEKRFPLVSKMNGELKFYYSFWLAEKSMPSRQRQAFDAFRRAVATIAFHEFKMGCNDVLIVDNSVILHGRRVIKNQGRKLKRLWIRSIQP